MENSGSPAPANAPEQPKKNEQTYETKVSLMSSRQLQSELLRKRHNDERPRINSAFAEVLSIVHQNHLDGMLPYLR